MTKMKSVTEKETGNAHPGACVDVLPRCWSKTKEGGGAVSPPGPLPWICHCSHTITLRVFQVLPRHGCPKEMFYRLGLWLRVKRNEILSSTMVTGAIADQEEKEHLWMKLTGK